MKLPEFLRNPNNYVIIFILIVLAMISTWALPAGEFDRQKDPNTGRTVVVPDSFHYIEPNRVDPFEMLQAIPKGIKETAGIIAFIFLISGSIQIVRGTGAIDAGIINVVQKMKGKDTPLLVVMMFLFSLLGAAFGFAEETIPLIPIGVAMAVALGYDRVVGFHIVRTAAFVGFAGAFMNPFTIGVAQGIAELPLFSGLGYRLICYGVFYLIGLWYVLSYAKKVKADPTKSIIYGYKGDVERKDLELDMSQTEFTGTHRAVLLVLFVGIIFLVYGVIKKGWYTTELSALFLAIGLISGFVSRMPVNSIAKEFVKGMSGVTYGALIVGFARAIVVVLSEGQVLDTIIYYLSQPLMSVGSVTAAVGMFIVQSLINFFIGSGSGQAAATMPIMTPLSDVIGITRQTAVLAFQFGDGITNMFYPAMMYYLVFADIPYNKWARHILPLTLILSAAAAVLVAIAGIINYGPF
ncbi:MAG: putative basic amino acid antiporter YfcC [Firmicutes bacterium]|jgi:uncharacterized ion transporter superfamily protein YfcC|nr:putative basic amino acid antiporter YfcC [Bacillota bacterium]